VTLGALLVLTVLTMLPVTGVVPILKRLIQDHYGVGDLATSLFMSINMVGALVAAPLLGRLADRHGRPRDLLVACALADAALWVALSLQPSFAVLMALRLLEGAAHIGALTMLMAVMSHASAGPGRRPRMAAMGGAIIFGVALGAPLGGALGRAALLLPLQLGAAVMVGVALAALLALPGRVGEGTPPAPAPARRRWPRLKVPPPLRLPYLFSFIDRLTVGIFIVGFALYSAGLGHGSLRTGLLIGAFMLTFTALSYPAGRVADRVGLWPLVLLGSAGYAVAYGAVAWGRGGLLWALMVLCGAMSAAMFGPNLMLVVRGSDPESRAAAMAGFNAAGSLGFLLGPLTAGATLELSRPALGDPTAFRWLFGATGALELLCVLWALWRLRPTLRPTPRTT